MNSNKKYKILFLENGKMICSFSKQCDEEAIKVKDCEILIFFYFFSSTYKSKHKYKEMALKIKKPSDLEKIAKYMTEGVKQTSSKKHDRFWDLKDLIYYFEKDNNFDCKVRVKIWEEMNAFEMKKTYKNILKLLNAIVKGNKK